MSRQNRIALIRKIEGKRGSKLLCCVTSDRQNALGVLAKDFIPLFFEHLKRFPGQTRIDVFLSTDGGDSLAAFGLSRLLREFTEFVAVLIPLKCHSAGTLFALGANRIVMARPATLSPVDPSVTGHLNPVVEIIPGQRQLLPVSVESVAGFRSLVTEEWQLNPDGVSTAFRLLAERINPLALGDVYRSRQQIERLARTLLTLHRDDQEDIQQIILKLTRTFGSHDYLISRKEASALLGSQVEPMDEDLETLASSLLADFREEMKLGQLFDFGMVAHAAMAAGQKPPISDEQKAVMIESDSGGDEFERSIQLSVTQPIAPPGAPATIQSKVIRAGWKHYN